MPLPNFTLAISNKSFVSTAMGLYANASSTFGSIRDTIRISAGKYNSKTKLTTATFFRQLEKEETINGTIYRRPLNVQLTVQAHKAFTAAEIDLAVAELNELASVANINYVLNGGQ